MEALDISNSFFCYYYIDEFSKDPYSLQANVSVWSGEEAIFVISVWFEIFLAKWNVKNIVYFAT